MSKNREAILEFFKENKQSSFTAYDVSDYLKSKMIDMHLATIYRNLDKLTEEEKLFKYKSAQDNSFYYQWVLPNNKCHEHLHMKCRVCEKLFHLECDYMKEFSTHLMKYHGFELECDNSILLGVCKECGGDKNEV